MDMPTSMTAGRGLPSNPPGAMRTAPVPATYTASKSGPAAPRACNSLAFARGWAGTDCAARQGETTGEHETYSAERLRWRRHARRPT